MARSRNTSAAGPVLAPQAVRRMPRAERRAQILDAATRAFARAGFTATSLEDVAAEAGVTHVILYRHFDSKTELYRAVLDGVVSRLSDKLGIGDYDEGSVAELLRAAAEDPDGFRLLFRHATREPEFREVIDSIRLAAAEITDLYLTEEIVEGPWRQWASRLVPTLILEAVIAWLDSGQPDPDSAADRLVRAVQAVVHAAQGD
jgi:AcrR family transcriptional regulator